MSKPERAYPLGGKVVDTRSTMPHTGPMDKYCEDCGADFPEDCHCAGNQEMLAKMHERQRGEFRQWRGMDGHLYEGWSGESSAYAAHRDDCGCPGSVNFDPDSWY